MSNISNKFVWIIGGLIALAVLIAVISIAVRPNLGQTTTIKATTTTINPNQAATIGQIAIINQYGGAVTAQLSQASATDFNSPIYQVYYDWGDCSTGTTKSNNAPQNHTYQVFKYGSTGNTDAPTIYQQGATSYSVTQACSQQTIYGYTITAYVVYYDGNVLTQSRILQVSH